MTEILRYAQNDTLEDLTLSGAKSFSNSINRIKSKEA
jgi:hypothetical protein